MTDRYAIAHIMLPDCDGHGCRVIVRSGVPVRWTPCIIHRTATLVDFWQVFQDKAVTHSREERATCEDPRCQSAAHVMAESKQGSLW